jgi:prephenate dehydratase
MSKQQLTLGALGGPETFNGQAAELLRSHYPVFSRVVYFPTSERTMEAVTSGEVDASCGQEQTTKGGFHPLMQARISQPGSALYVIAEASQYYRCSLLGKKNTDISSVRLVLGHTGSIAHSRQWLEAKLPQAKIETVETNSLGAAQMVLEGDGSIVSVGSGDLAEKTGLLELVKDIDDGSAVNYWAVSAQPLFSDQPTRLVIAGRLGDESTMSRLICEMAETGFILQAVSPRPTGLRLFEYDYLFRFRGAGSLLLVKTTLERFRGLRLAGAWCASE